MGDQKLDGAVGGAAGVGQSEGPKEMEVSLTALFFRTLVFRSLASIASSGTELSGGGSVTPSKRTLHHHEKFFL